MTKDDEVAIQRAVERALVNIWLPLQVKAEKRNEIIKMYSDAINARTDFDPLQFNDPVKTDQVIKVKE